MKRLLLLTLLAAFSMPTAKAFGKGTDIAVEPNDLDMGQKTATDEFGSLLGPSGLVDVNCKYKSVKVQTAKAEVAVAKGADFSSKRGR